MTTDEIIRKLRYRAEGETSAKETEVLLNEAADRLEELAATKLLAAKLLTLDVEAEMEAAKQSDND